MSTVFTNITRSMTEMTLVLISLRDMVLDMLSHYNSLVQIK